MTQNILLQNQQALYCTINEQQRYLIDKWRQVVQISSRTASNKGFYLTITS